MNEVILENQSSILKSTFLNGSRSGRQAYEKTVTQAMQTVLEGLAECSQPYSGRHPDVLAAEVNELNICPEGSSELDEVLERVKNTVLNHSMAVSHPACMAHLHCPVVLPAIAAEMVISAINQSMDSWDQSPAATHLEQRMVKWLCSLYQLSTKADGVFTSGGTQSNYMGLMLARDAYCKTKFGIDVKKEGLPKDHGRLKILCSEHAHFTVRQAAAELGLGEQAVVPIATDANQRLAIQEMEKKLDELKRRDQLPFAIVATAGTTDFGSIDPLQAITNIAKRDNLWLHVDAAYGGALALSERHRPKLKGIQEADSLAVDFHKLFFQPISCGAFLLNNREHFKLMKLHADYLNPEEDESEGSINLVGKSTQTTRRFDALKLFISLQTIGRQPFAEIIDQTLKQAQRAATLIDISPRLERLNTPEINAVVFRYRGISREWTNEINRFIHKSSLLSGEAIFAKTKVEGEVYLKFTLLNPLTTEETVQEVLNKIQILGDQFNQMKRSG